jgi:hypothetical protein
MNQKIETSTERKEFTRPFLPVLVLLTIVALSATIIQQQKETNSSWHNDFTHEEYHRLSVFPWVVAGAHSLYNGLNAFSGEQFEYPPSAIRFGVLAGLLFTFVFCPTIFLFLWRDRRLEKKQFFRDRPMSVAGLGYGVCGVMTLFMVITILPIAILREKVQTSLQAAQTIQSNKDDLINTINAIVIDMKQYQILPKRLGGGEGSCNGYLLRSDLARTSDGTFSTSVTNDSITIRGQSLLSPSSRIIVELSPGAMARTYSLGAYVPSGGLWRWTYEGEF